MTTREQAREGFDREAPESPDGYQLRLAYESGADAASDVWEPKLDRLKALLRMFHTESSCRYPDVPCGVCEALQDE